MLLAPSSHPTLDRPLMHDHSALTFPADHSATPLHAPFLTIPWHDPLHQHTATHLRNDQYCTSFAAKAYITATLALIMTEHAPPPISLDPASPGCHHMNFFKIAADAF